MGIEYGPSVGPRRRGDAAFSECVRLDRECILPIVVCDMPRKVDTRGFRFSFSGCVCSCSTLLISFSIPTLSLMYQ